MTPHPDTEIVVPRVTVAEPDTGIHRSKLRGRERFRVWWHEDWVLKSRMIKAASIAEARIERDRIYDEMVTAGAIRRSLSHRKTVAGKIRHARRRGKEAYIRVVVTIRGVHVGSFNTMEEAIAARDAHVARQAQLRKHLKKIRRAIA